MAARWTDELLDQLSQEGDPPVDEVIRQHAQTAGPAADARLLIRSVAQHLELPPEHRSPAVAAYLAAPPPLPAWADAALLDQAARFFSDNALAIGSGLFCASLPEAYASPRGSKVLVLTARLVTDPVRRVYETAQMILHAMARHGLQPPAPGQGAEPGRQAGHGYADIRRVRLMHGAVRYLVANDPDVDRVPSLPVPERGWLGSWGLPINQEDLLGTLMTFTVAIFEVLEQLGVPASEADQTAYLHRWSVVGHLLGIRPDLLPIEPASAVELTAAIRRREVHATADSQVLTDALLGALEPALWLPFRGLIPATVRWYVGNPVADSLRIGPSPWRFLLEGPVREAMHRAGLGATHHTAVRKVVERWNRRLMRQFLRANRDGDRPRFDMPDELARAFGSPERPTAIERFHMFWNHTVRRQPAAAPRASRNEG
jgi:hypothetical protein